jgi:uroporphyrinogen decarboxylase
MRSISGELDENNCAAGNGVAPSFEQTAFVQACRRNKSAYTPVWLMRQAGRFMKEYREIRSKVGFLDLCKNPELASSVTCMAVDMLCVDAAIIFADILLPLEPLGVGLQYSKGDGPVIERPVRAASDVAGLLPVEAAQSLAYVAEAIKLTRAALKPDIPLIGFAGAPYTLASYLVEGGASRHYERTKALMYREPQVWHSLMERLVSLSADYLNMQIAAGAQVVQLFDSWVGSLSQEDYRQFVFPHSKKLIEQVADGIPVIHFGTGTEHLLSLMRQAGGDVIGLDWRSGLADNWKRLGYDVGVQGNLDPVVLFAEPAEIRRRAKRILEEAAGRPGHIFNLGHGILPETPVDNVKYLVEVVHELGAN